MGQAMPKPPPGLRLRGWRMEKGAGTGPAANLRFAGEEARARSCCGERCHRDLAVPHGGEGAWSRDSPHRSGFYYSSNDAET